MTSTHRKGIREVVVPGKCSHSISASLVISWDKRFTNAGEDKCLLDVWHRCYDLLPFCICNNNNNNNNTNIFNNNNN